MELKDRILKTEKLALLNNTYIELVSELLNSINNPSFTIEQAGDGSCFIVIVYQGLQIHLDILNNDLIEKENVVFYLYKDAQCLLWEVGSLSTAITRIKETVNAKEPDKLF